MKQRDLYFLQELAKQGKIKFVNLAQYGEYAVAEATNGFCYMRIAEKNNKRFQEGFFTFTGRGNHNKVELPKSYEIYSLEGKNIGSYQYTEPFNIKIGEQGEFKATFKREDLVSFLKELLDGWSRLEAHRYRIIFKRDSYIWKIRGFYGDKEKTKEIEPNFDDTITDNTFQFTVNPHTLRHILKWFEGDSVSMYFQNGNYECRTAIFLRDTNKLAVLMPIARKS